MGEYFPDSRSAARVRARRASDSLGFAADFGSAESKGGTGSWAASRGFDHSAVELPLELAGSTADIRENPDPTQMRRWHFSSRPAGPLSKRSFADCVEKSAPCGSGHSRVATTDRDTITVERLHPKVST